MTVLFTLSALLQCTFLFSAMFSTDGAAWNGMRGSSEEVGNVGDSHRLLQFNTTSFKLINAITDTAITDLSQNLVVNLGSVQPNTLTIQVVAAGWNPGSVKIALTGPINRTVVERGTFSLCGNSGTNFFPCTGLKLGTYSILAELYTLRNAQGSLLSSTRLDFVLSSVGPVGLPTKAPTQAPIKAPTMLPTGLPTKAPTKLPISLPTSMPFTNAPLAKPPTSAPISSPTSSPVSSPTSGPTRAPTVKSPTIAPFVVSTGSPVSTPSCTVPRLVGDWSNWEKYPIPVAESMGALIGDDFVIVAGFSGKFDNVTRRVFAFDTRNATAKWREMDEVPVTGFTHAGYAVNGSQMYICGSYVGGVNVIRDGPICLLYTHTAAPGSQWSYLPNLTDGRGGGGFFHIKETNSLVYATGATRRGITIDQNTTWELSLNNISGGWVTRAQTLYKANHISHVTAFYEGRYRYYIAGGQLQQKERDGNQADLIEWDQASKTWIRRTNMTLPRGHASASTIPYGCGFIMIGGAINNGTQTADITYYGIDTDSWTSIGNLPRAINTPVCEIVQNLNASDWVYCNTGYVSTTNFAWRRRITA